MDSKQTPGPWEYACDSYGKVQHSRKACVYANVKGSGGDRLQTVAARIENWDDARLIAAAPDLLDAATLALRVIEQLTETPPGTNQAFRSLMASIAKAGGNK